MSCSYQNIEKQGKLVRAEALCTFEKMLVSGTKEYESVFK